MRIGMGRSDLTPRVGVELAGFGPFINRHSVGVRDRLWARAMAFETDDGAPVVVVSNDICVIYRATTERVCELVQEATGVPPERVMVCCTHTHSGPESGGLIGWAQADPPWVELLPDRIARAAIAAIEDLRPATLSHARVPCEGIGVNREYDQRPTLEEALREDWRPAQPELTDTEANVLVARDEAGEMIGFAGSFGCHPVVCCAQTRWIHGDFCGVGTNLLEREHLGSVGLFLQGANGDVSTCVVHEPEQESLLALDVIAARYARAVRHGIAQAQPLEVDRIDAVRPEVQFSRREYSLDDFRALLAEQEAIIHAGPSDDDREVRMAVVRATAYRRFIDAMEQGRQIVHPTFIQGMRIGPLGLYAAPFETFQAVKNDILGGAAAPIPLLVGVANDSLGYAPDRTVAARGGYAADQVPLMQGTLPFANIHDELVEALLGLDEGLFGAGS